MLDASVSIFVLSLSIVFDIVFILFIAYKDPRSSIYCYSDHLSYIVQGLLCIHIVATVCSHFGVLGPFLLAQAKRFSGDTTMTDYNSDVFYIASLVVCSGIQTMALYQFAVYFICENRQMYTYYQTYLLKNFDVSRGIAICSILVFLCMSLSLVGVLLCMANFLVWRACIILCNVLLFSTGVYLNMTLIPHSYEGYIH